MVLLALLATVTGCIHNDIPYPRIPAGFSSIVAENTVQAASIDSVNRTVTFFLNEEADPAKVRVSEWTLSPDGAQWADSAAFKAGVDLTSPKATTVRLYQDYTWTINIVQEIERRFTIDGQIGATTIDVAGQRIIVSVPMQADLRHLVVTDMKLGGPEAQYSPQLVGESTDFTGPVRVEVTEHGRTRVWTIYVETAESTVTIDRADAWTSVAWLYASAQEGKDNGFQYREAGQTEWVNVPEMWITHQGGAFTARLQDLKPLTTYEARAYSDTEYTPMVDFTTEDVYYLPNGNLESWWLDGKVWCPWPEGGQRYWDTGNKGATTLGSSNTYPDTDTPSGTGYSACLETRFVGIAGIGKLAAGNLFAGAYLRTVGTNGVLSMGREFTMHPLALEGEFKYKTAPISSVASGFEQMKGQPDTCAVWIALIDAPEPFEIRTAPSDRHLFDPEASDVIAYGRFEVGYDVDNWTRFTVPLVYKDTYRRPTYILIVASASKYGDYFTGGNGAIMWVDNLSLKF